MQRWLPFLLCLGGCIDVAVAQRSADAMIWNAERRLTWEDFRGPVNPGAAVNTAATTATSLGWTYSYELERSRGRCTYRITDIATEALFDPNASWVKPAHATAIVLEHEQGHFDLTQIHKMELDRAASDIEGKRTGCGDPDATLAEVEAKVAEEVGPVRERIWQKLQSVQDQYDRETGHGTRVDAQREWTARIQQALRRGLWN
jgi:hypothetical protein